MKKTCFFEWLLGDRICVVSECPVTDYFWIGWKRIIKTILFDSVKVVGNELVQIVEWISPAKILGRRQSRSIGTHFGHEPWRLLRRMVKKGPRKYRILVFRSHKQILYQACFSYPPPHPRTETFWPISSLTRLNGFFCMYSFFSQPYSNVSLWFLTAKKYTYFIPYCTIRVFVTRVPSLWVKNESFSVHFEFPQRIVVRYHCRK